MEKKNNLVLIIFACFLILGSGIFIFNAAQKPHVQLPPTINTNNKTVYSYLENNKKEIEFFVTTDGVTTELETYKCKTYCYVTNIGGEGPYFSDAEGIVFLTDGENGKQFLYDSKVGERISDYFSAFYKLYLGNFQDEVRSFVVKGFNSKKMGVIDLNGNVIIPLIYDTLGYSVESVADVYDYSYGLDYIIAKKTGKWGIITLSKGEEILPFEFDDVQDYNGHYATVKIDSKWFIYDVSNHKIHSEIGYDYIALFDEFFVAVDNKMLDIIDYSGISLIKDKIPTYLDYDRGACCSNPPGIQVEKVENKLKIYLDRNLKDLPSYETLQYEFDLQTKELVLTQP